MDHLYDVLMTVISGIAIGALYMELLSSKTKMNARIDKLEVDRLERKIDRELHQNGYGDVVGGDRFVSLIKEYMETIHRLYIDNTINAE